jgi:hypothetical protein|tara:strand:+ start:58 stop:645 length:588 start_codon:yes stop_codon:yes gene_type:complete
MNLIESIKKVIKEAEEELLNKVIDFFIHKGEVDIKELRYFGVDDKEQIQNIMNRFFNEKGHKNLITIKEELEGTEQTFQCGGYNLNIKIDKILSSKSPYYNDMTTKLYVTILHHSEVTILEPPIDSQGVEIDNPINIHDIFKDDFDYGLRADIINEIEDCVLEKYNDFLQRKIGIPVRGVWVTLQGETEPRKYYN